MRLSHLKNGIIGVVVLLMVNSTIFAMEESYFSEEAFEEVSEEEQNTELALDLIKYGNIINKQIVFDGIIFDLKNIYVDKYSYRMLFSIEKADHTAFKEAEKIYPNIYIEPLLDNVEINDLIVSHQERMRFRTSTSRVIRCNLPDSTDKKIYFIVDECSETKMSQQAALSINDVEISEVKELFSSFDLYQYFEEAKGVPKVQKSSDETKPEHMLERGNLGIKLFEDRPNLTIDNLGFVDNKLHIRLITQSNKPIDTFYNLDLLDKDDLGIGSQGWFSYMPSDLEKDLSSGEDKGLKENLLYENEEYYVGEVTNKEALKDVIVQINLERHEKITDGFSCNKLEMPINKREVKKTVNKELPFGEGNMQLFEVNISPLSICLKFNLDQETNESGKYSCLYPIQVQLKNGEILDCREESTPIYSSDGKHYECVFFNEGKLFKLEDVASIIIEGATFTYKIDC